MGGQATKGLIAFFGDIPDHCQRAGKTGQSWAG